MIFFSRCLPFVVSDEDSSNSKLLVLYYVIRQVQNDEAASLEVAKTKLVEMTTDVSLLAVDSITTSAVDTHGPLTCPKTPSVTDSKGP